jgi:mannose-6-phosphate isomerase-like protein (cupin superfamily)
MSYSTDPATVIRRADQKSAGPTGFVATGGQTRGDFGLFERVMEPGGSGPGPHYHLAISESFLVLEGRLAVLSQQEWLTAGAGDLIYVPKGSVHGFRSAGPDVGARFLILFTPGTDREEYFEGLVAMTQGGRTPTTEEIDAFAACHDQINLRG